MRYYRFVLHCRRIVLILLTVLWQGLVKSYYLLLMIYRKWYTDGLPVLTPGRVRYSIVVAVLCIDMVKHARQEKKTKCKLTKDVILMKLLYNLAENNCLSWWAAIVPIDYFQY